MPVKLPSLCYRKPASLPPSGRMLQISNFPLRLEKKAIWFPLGDQRGLRSQFSYDASAACSMALA